MRIFIFITALLFLVALDIASKWWVVSSFQPHVPYFIFPWLNIHLTFNTGAAFSMLSHSGPWKFLIFGASAAILFLLLLKENIQRPSKINLITSSLIVGGAIGNGIDRLVSGKVVDFISVHYQSWYFAIFNFADIYITLGSCLWILDQLFRNNQSKKPQESDLPQ